MFPLPKFLGYTKQTETKFQVLWHQSVGWYTCICYECKMSGSLFSKGTIRIQGMLSRVFFRQCNWGAFQEFRDGGNFFWFQITISNQITCQFNKTILTINITIQTLKINHKLK